MNNFAPIQIEIICPLWQKVKALYYLFLGIKKIFVTITNENINNSQFNVRNESTKLSQMHNKKLNFSSNLDQAYISIFRQAESAPCQNFMTISNIYVVLNKTLLVIKIAGAMQQSSSYVWRRRHILIFWKHWNYLVSNKVSLRKLYIVLYC